MQRAERFFVTPTAFHQELFWIYFGFRVLFRQAAYATPQYAIV